MTRGSSTTALLGPLPRLLTYKSTDFSQPSYPSFLRLPALLLLTESIEQEPLEHQVIRSFDGITFGKQQGFQLSAPAQLLERAHLPPKIPGFNELAVGLLEQRDMEKFFSHFFEIVRRAKEV